MDDRIEQLRQVTEKAARHLAARQATAAHRYGDVLARYGRGELGTGGFGSAVLSLAVDEGVKYSEDVARSGADYVKAALALIGVDVKSAPSKAAAGKGATTTESAPSRKKSRHRTTAA